MSIAMNNMQRQIDLGEYGAEQDDPEMDHEQQFEDNVEENDYSDIEDINDRDDERRDAGPPELNPAYVKMISDELLFEIQGVGAIKLLNGYNVYVKHKQCFPCLGNIFKQIKRDSIVHPIVKKILGEWKFVEKDLIPLLIFHNKDKKLSYLICQIISLLTEIPNLSEKDLNQVTKDKRETAWMHHKSQYNH